MNDFTKEELEYLHRKFMLTYGDDFEHNLESKLQSMIDNYCEHSKDINSDDVVYSFEFPENSGNDIADVLLATPSKSRNIGAGFMKYAYETKSGALAAMRKRLMEIENED